MYVMGLELYCVEHALVEKRSKNLVIRTGNIIH
jgi:hypothetical protein